MCALIESLARQSTSWPAPHTINTQTQALCTTGPTEHRELKLSWSSRRIVLPAYLHKVVKLLVLQGCVAAAACAFGGGGGGSG